MALGMWPEAGTPLAEAFDAAARQAHSFRMVLTHQEHPCELHTDPGAEMYETEDGTEMPVTDAMREQWEKQGVTVIRQVYVGTCHTNGCDPSLPDAERWQ